MTRCDNCAREARIVVQVYDDSVAERWCLGCVRGPHCRAEVQPGDPDYVDADIVEDD